VISPYFDKEIATIPESNFSDLDYAVQKAKAAFP
jgi:acyl-CoA reductase-like NAD-dependent aldehyde dehydrogenase